MSKKTLMLGGENTLLKRVVAATLAALLLLGTLPTTAFAAEQITVTYTGATYSYQDGGGRPTENLHGMFSGNLKSGVVYCGEHGIPAPMGQSKGDKGTYSMSEFSDTTVAKVLYYGWQGPAQWSGFSSSSNNSVYQLFSGNDAKSKAEACGLSVTAMALTRAYNSNGGHGRVYDISGLAEFEAYIKSAAAPPSGFHVYLINSGSSSTQNLFTWEYIPTGNLTLKKVSSMSAPAGYSLYSLAGATYGVYGSSSNAQSDSSRLGTLTTKADGTSNVISLNAGTYYVKEISAPAHYSLDMTVHQVTVSSGSTATVTSSDAPNWAWLKLKKSIAKNSALVAECPEQYSLAGAEYGVFKSYAGADSELSGDRVGTITTKADGTTDAITVDGLSTVYVKEMKAPLGYELDKNIHTVSLTTCQVTEFSVSDEPRFDPMRLVLQKRDATGKGLPIEGAEFTVKYYTQLVTDTTGLTPKRTWVLKTDAAGIIRLEDSFKVGGDEFFKGEDGQPVGLIGTYEFTETLAPRGYAAMEGKLIKQLTSSGASVSGTVYVAPTIDEYPQTVSIKVTKIDAETGEPTPQGLGEFEGAEYTVAKYNELWDRDDEVGTITIGADGTGTLGNLSPGLYKVYEKKAPSGYLLNDEVQYVNAGIKENNTANFEYSITSKETPTLTKILKIDAKTHKPVAGAELAIYKAEDGEAKGDPLTTWTSGDEAHEIKGIGAGDYVLRELTAPDGYVKADDVPFTVADGQELIEVTMEDDFTKVEINKIELGGGTAISGATLQLLDEDKELVEEWVTDGKPHRFEHLPAGTYYIHEKEAPSGYFTAPDVEIVVEEKADLQSFTMEDDFTRLEITKSDITTGEPVIGATLAIYKADADGKATGEPLHKWVTTEDAYFIEALPAGDYVLRELLTPAGSGYAKATDMLFTVGNTTEIQKIDMKDGPTKVEITKSDITTGEPVIGATLAIFKAGAGGKAASEALYTWTTTEEPYYIEALPAGDYVLREISAPTDKGYVTANDVIFTVTDTADIQKVDMEDDHTRVEIKKLGEISNKLLAGAKLRLLDADGNVVSEWMSKADSSQFFEYLPVGTYMVQEVSAPAGYTISGDITFTVKDDAAKKTIVVRNYKVPKTGDENDLGLWITLAVMALSAGTVATAMKRKED